MKNIDPLIKLFHNKKHELKIFMKGIVEFIGEHPDLTDPESRIIHSYKYRIKETDHLKEKIRRKVLSGASITEENFFEKITDLAGVRILHLYQDDFSYIDSVIRKRVESGDWSLGERPKAYTWDPEAALYFGKFDLQVIEKSSSYTSVHYLLKPRSDSNIYCELQVRTLFEEIWGEVDHQLNYPSPTLSVACREQLKVLSKIVGAGSRLLDSIKRVHSDNIISTTKQPQ